MKSETVLALLLVVVILVIFIFKAPIVKFVAELSPGRQATVSSGSKTLNNVQSLPFTLTITNTGNVQLTNIRIDSSGTTPSQLAQAFVGKTINSLAPGQTATITSNNVDVEALATPSGATYTFQVKVLADYVSSGVTKTIEGYTAPLVLTIKKDEAPGLSVSITW